MNLKSKLFAGAVGVAMVLGVASPMIASAQTAAELTAQINSLLAMIAQLQSQIAGGASSAAATTFTKDLTVGSTGAEVSALQSFLVSKGFLTMPAGVAMGTFGPLTKSALVAYQTSAGITPAAGYFGPITRAKVNAAAPVVVTPGTTPSVPGVITTPGVEGTLSVTSNNSGLVSTVYEGDSEKAIYGFNVEAKTSDIAIQRVKINLGSATTLYNKGYAKIYLTDGSNVLASSDLNSSTVVKDGGNYYITLTGFNFVVPKAAKKQLVIKADVRSSIDSTDRTALNLLAGILIPANGVRGVDGAGIDQYGESALSARNVTFSADLTDSAALKISLNNSSPVAQDVVAADGAENDELDKLTLLTFDLKSEKDAITLQDLTVRLTYAGSGTATATTVYLYEGSTELDNASVAATSATAASASFTDLEYTISKDSTKTLTVKADIRTADGTIRTVLAAVTAGSDVTPENSLGDTIVETGSATGYAMGLRDSGVELALSSKGTAAVSGTNGNSTDISTSTLTATFNVKIKAVGNDVILGTVGSTTNPLFSANNFVLYRNGVKAVASVATSTSFTIPSACTTIVGQDSCTLAEGSEVTIPVTFQIPGRTAAQAAIASGIYSVALEGATWGVTHQTSTFMAGELAWRTNEVSFP
ncbi:MAG: peptidoglycan-binding domain-containing protein [Patescibacteria group bacterium]